MTYADLKNSLLASRQRQTKITDILTATRIRLAEALKTAEEKTAVDMAEEKGKETQLLSEIQAHLSADLGQPVVIGRPAPVKRTVKLPAAKTGTPGFTVVYQKEKVLARIQELRSQELGFEVIADTLNREGFKPLSADSFRGPAVYQLFKKHQVIKTAA